MHNFLAKNQILTIIQQAKSPRYRSVRLLPLPETRDEVQGHRLASLEDSQQNATEDLRAIPEDDFQRFFQQRQDS
jgi:hypothetical protein